MDVKTFFIIGITALFVAVAIGVAGNALTSNQAKVSNQELVGNGGFEDYPVSPAFPPNWMCKVDPAFSATAQCAVSTTIFKETNSSNVHSGNNAVRLVVAVGSNSTTYETINQALVLTPGIYKFNAWGKSDGTTIIQLAISPRLKGSPTSDGAVICPLLITAAIYTQDSCTFTADATHDYWPTAVSISHTAGKTFYVDDFSIMRVYDSSIIGYVTSTQMLLNLILLIVVAIIVLNYVSMFDSD